MSGEQYRAIVFPANIRRVHRVVAQGLAAGDRDDGDLTSPDQPSRYIEGEEEGSELSLVGLRTGLLKRFESSSRAFANTLDRIRIRRCRVHQRRPRLNTLIPGRRRTSDTRTARSRCPTRPHEVERGSTVGGRRLRDRLGLVDDTVAGVSRRLAQTRAVDSGRRARNRHREQCRVSRCASSLRCPRLRTGPAAPPRRREAHNRAVDRRRVLLRHHRRRHRRGRPRSHRGRSRRDHRGGPRHRTRTRRPRGRLRAYEDNPFKQDILETRPRRRGAVVLPARRVRGPL